MRNSSQRPGCIRALPASQSCQVRSVEDMSAAAAVWESPASSLACRISDGVGLFTANDAVDFFEQGDGIGAVIVRNAREVGALDLEVGAIPIDVAQRGFGEEYFDLGNGSGWDFVGDLNGGHDLLQLSGLRRATHELNYTRNPCNSKSFLQKINEAPTPPHNAGHEGRQKA